MISKIGRSPVTAAPKAPADIASSEIGVSITRSPKLLVEARGHREHAARDRHVLAEEDDGLVALHLRRDRLADRDAVLERVVSISHYLNSFPVVSGSGNGAARPRSTTCSSSFATSASISSQRSASIP